jgi:D-arabinitol dehydrogenase (NADP+)
VVSDATGALVVLAQTLALTRTWGTVFVYGMTPQSTVWPTPVRHLPPRLTINGSFAQQFSFDRALSALRNDRVKAEGMISKLFTPDAYDEALAAVADSSLVKALIVHDERRLPRVGRVCRTLRMCSSATPWRPRYGTSPQ